MCGICGCSDHQDSSHHEKTHHTHHHNSAELIQVEQNLLAKNNQYASENQQYFTEHGITAINIMSSPGSGKTTLLCRTISDLASQKEMAVIVGDQQTDQDALQLKSTGAKAVQINTGKTCHLDAHMLGHSLESLSLKSGALLFIENIGNLVCPALFELGEHKKVVILSVTEGENKPVKYPDMFRDADLLLITKTDLIPYVDFNIKQCISYAKQINPDIESINLSAKNGEGLESWYQWINSLESNI